MSKVLQQEGKIAAKNPKSQNKHPGTFGCFPLRYLFIVVVVVFVAVVDVVDVVVVVLLIQEPDANNCNAVQTCIGLRCCVWNWGGGMSKCSSREVGDGLQVREKERAHAKPLPQLERLRSYP